MSEPKRVSFMTIESTSEFLKKPEKADTAAGTKLKSVRMELDIFEPDEYKFPEFNYKKLIHIEKKKQKRIAKLPNGTNNNDPFGGDMEDDIARIAKEMEAKYGTGSSYSKSTNYEIDRGAGYDENDSFIDNTDAYDEIIPEDVDTVRGGFYVNSGFLEFKKTPNFERPGDEIRMPKARKRALSTSSESSASDTEQAKKVVTPEKPKKKKIHSEKKTKSATSSSDEQGKAKKLKKEKAKVVEPLPVVKEGEKKKDVIDDSKKVVKTTTVKDMLRAKRDNLRKMEQGKSSGGTTTTTDNDDDDGSESVSSLAASESSHESTRDVQTNEGSQMSLLNISADLVQLITNLKQYASTTAKKDSNFFDNNVIEQLLMIDTKAKSQGIQVRAKVYDQLSTFMPCTKNTILSKVKKCREQQAEAKVKVDIKKLQVAVKQAMSDIERKYSEELRQYEIKKASCENAAELKLPKRRFHWNDQCRNHFTEVMGTLDEYLKILKIKKELTEEIKTKYLKENVVTAWPEGWMKVEDLLKELKRKEKKENRTLPQNITATNGTKLSQQKTELRLKNTTDQDAPACINGTGTKISPPVPALSPSVIKKSSDHSINSIMSTSPSPPTTSHHSSKNPKEGSTAKVRPTDVEKKLSSVDHVLSTIKKDISSSLPAKMPDQTVTTTTTTASVERPIRISDGSDSDCTIVESSPVKITAKPHSQQLSHNYYNNNNKLNHSPSTQQPGEVKKSKKQEDYSSLIKNICSLTEENKNSPLFLNNPLSSPINEMHRKMDTSHGYETSASESDFFSELLNKYTKHHEANT